MEVRLAGCLLYLDGVRRWLYKSMWRPSEARASSRGAVKDEKTLTELVETVARPPDLELPAQHSNPSYANRTIAQTGA